MALPFVTNFYALLFAYIIFTLSFCISSCHERQLFAEINPQCDPSRCKDSVVEVVHVQADGPNDTMHYVWCFRPKPTILLALTSRTSKISIDWKSFPNASSSIAFSPAPIYSFGVLLNQFYEFNDVNNTGLLDVNNTADSYINKVELPDTWEKKLYQLNLDSAVLIMEGSWKNKDSFVKGGIVRLQLEAYRKQDHGSILPHLLHSANSTQMELSLRDVFTNSSFEQSRFAAEILLAANESSNSQVITTAFKSLDDERTPGVFSLVDLQTTSSKKHKSGGYLQWRPVAYVADERDIVNSTETALYEVKNVTSKVCEGTLFAAYFGKDLETNLLKAVNVSFGAKDDGFFKKSNISIWTVTIGYGNPPDENFSLFTILVMSTCLGLPAVIILLSGLYIAVRRISYRKDDLFLSE